MFRKNNQWFGVVVFLMAVLLLSSGLAIAGEQDKTLSPYFQVIGEANNENEILPLQQTAAEVVIAGVIADVKVRQVYQNRGVNPIEAVYVFPGSTRAAVYGMQMTIGERVVVAKVKERQAARVAYTQARQAGKRASLLEQQRANVFQMNVANIMPGDQIVVELSYTELLIPEQGVYEFVYPEVVGPRYSETPVESAADTEQWIANPYLQEGEAVPYGFDIKTTIAAGLPIQALMSPSHQVDVHYDEQGSALIQLQPGSTNSGDRDYILRYQLRGKQIESGLLLYEGEQENFFLMMSQPPQRVKPEQIPSREYIFIVDVSGSMHGFPLNTSKRLMRSLLRDLRPNDSFNILFFSGGSKMLAQQSLLVTPANIERAIAMMESQRGGGGTRLLPALQKAMTIPAPETTSRSFVVVTDGYVSVEKEAFDYVRDHLNQANFFAFGIGSSVNRFLIEGLARSGRGEPFVMTSPDQAPKIAKRFRDYIESPLLTGISLEFNDFEVYDVEPQKVPDLFAERPLVVYGKWRGQAQGTIKIHGHTGTDSYSESIDVSTALNDDTNQALRYLWARQRIAELGDYQRLQPDSEQKAEITTLGLSYNLLTAYTSFIAIDQQIANTSGSTKSVKQPLPLPKGVSNLAVGGVVPTTPEPGLLSLLAVMLIALIALRLSGIKYSGSISKLKR
ncbi:MAG: VWA domain-containing protein [Gammaproteobacteria bacterium]|nr:VWA domain-containing protein [Gammaproteobacteria bacterium]